MKKIISVLILGMIAIGAFADQKGDNLAKKFFDLPESKDSSSKATMTIIDSTKEKKTREMEIFNKKDFKKDAVDSFTRFIEPADVKNTKFLVIGSKEGDDDQRLYLPALGKTRKISSSSKDGKFVGSDIFYYDLENRYFEDYTYTFKEENVSITDSPAFKDMKFAVVEQVAKDKNAPYSKTITWQNMKDNFIYKTEAYDKSGALWKTLYVLKTQIIDGIIVGTDTLVVNHKDNSKTRLELKDVKINAGISSDIFSVQNLEK